MSKQMAQDLLVLAAVVGYQAYLWRLYGRWQRESRAEDWQPYIDNGLSELEEFLHES